MNNRKKIRVFLVDDHPIVREGLVLYLGTQPDIQVVGQAGDADVALRELPPTTDILLLDLTLHDSHGFDLLKIVRQRLPKLAVIILSMHGEPSLVRRALELGARGYVRKDEVGARMADAIRGVHRGEVHIPADLGHLAAAGTLVPAASTVATHRPTPPGAKAPAPATALPQATARGTGGESEPARANLPSSGAAGAALTNREREILLMLADGCDRSEIAARLHVSRRTIDTHQSNLKAKLSVRSNRGLLLLASRYRDTLAHQAPRSSAGLTSQSLEPSDLPPDPAQPDSKA